MSALPPPGGRQGHSRVTDDKLCCAYRATNEAMIREHAQKGGFPASKISRVRLVI